MIGLLPTIHYLCSLNNCTDRYMAKLGYVFSVTGDDRLSADRDWMRTYGCAQIIEESAEHEKLRPEWHQLLASLERGDELIVTKFSHCVHNTRELATLIEFCRVKMIRLISLRDRIDSEGRLFPETGQRQVLEMFGSLTEEVAVLKRASTRVIYRSRDLAENSGKTGRNAAPNKQERERIIVSMYNNNHTIDDIWHVSGFSSRSSVFRILRKHGVGLNRRKKGSRTEE